MDESQSVTSLSLLRRVGAGGDEVACAEFVRRYEPLVRAIGRASRLAPQDCDDLAQEVMMAAIHALREERYEREMGRFKAFLKGIIQHKIEHFRRAGARRRVAAGVSIENAAGSIADPAPGPAQEYEEAFEREWHAVRVAAALDEIRTQVEPQTFQAYDLVVKKGMTAKQAARQLGMSRGAVDLAKHRVVQRIENIMRSASELTDLGRARID